ncbi:MAG: sodium-dependent transporter [Gammaproteobacteria bacterium]|nr:sodium-dependent transporter [Gammaproteobacteria bacterium]MDH5262948.1 sodium-dependent transporter [Gammaproteobacteria bacterium]MDH5584111.1 sodium-dependent transporter [Gammaproteobacteria bacterium]
MSNHTEQRFSSRIGLLLCVLGIAVGTGNIWRFPRIAAQNAGEDGAGAFLVAWLVFLFVWSVPLIIAEYALGRSGRMGVVGTFAKIAGKNFAWMGAFVGFVATAIMFYYSVVAGWCVYYLVQMAIEPLPLSTAAAQAAWDGFQGSGFPVVFHALAMGLGAFVIWNGIRSIERANRFLIPALLLIVLVSLARTLTLDGASEGIAFLFTPDWSTLAQPRVWLEALTQNAWDTGAGWGLILTYGAYMQGRHGVVKNAVITGVGNNTVSLLAAVIIFGTVFAILGAEMSKSEILEIMKSSGPAATGLTFIWMPQLFAKMPGGNLFAILFFLGLSFAAFSSLIAMIELSTRILVDFGVARRQAILGVCLVGFTLGVPSAINLDFFANQDFVWGVALMISGAFVAFAVIRHGATRFRQECIDNQSDDWRAGPVWDKLISLVIPLLAAVLLGWWLYQAAAVYAPDRWFDPLDPFSLMTCLVQWSVPLIVFILLNRWMAQKTAGIRGSGE